MYEKTKSYDFIFGSHYEADCSIDDDTLISSFSNFDFTNIGKIFFSLKVTDILYTFALGKSSKFKNLQLKQK